MTRAERLGHHALLFLEKHRPKSTPIEPVVVDGFGSFEFSSAIEYSMVALPDLAAPPGSQIEIRSAEHPAYRRVWRRVPRVEVRLAVMPSKRVRTTRNPLFRVNRADLWLRHSGANHKRETIAISKRCASEVERCAVLGVYLSYQESFWEKKLDATPDSNLAS